MRYFLFLLLCLPMIGFGQVTSPSVVSSSGDSYSNGNIIMDYTLGEIVVEAYGSPTTILTQGFHQEILRITTEVVNIDIKTGEISELEVETTI